MSNVKHWDQNMHSHRQMLHLTLVTHCLNTFNSDGCSPFYFSPNIEKEFVSNVF